MAYFTKNTFSKECALLGYNYYLLLCAQGIFPNPIAPSLAPDSELPPSPSRRSRSDPRVSIISVLYLFYKYQLHHSDMALNLATSLIYLEDTPTDRLESFVQTAARTGNATFNLVVYTAYLAHAWNDDITIRLKDWFTDVGKIYFSTVSEMNCFVWDLLSELKCFSLFADERRVRRNIRKLCQSPTDLLL